MNRCRADVVSSRSSKLWIRGASAVVGLGLLCAVTLTTLAQPPERAVNDSKRSPASPQPSSGQPQEQVATLAGGCFWCLEAVYERMEGVNDVVSGYTGDESAPNPTYQQVLLHLNNHAEAVQVYYDPSKTSYEQLLEVFFKIHDPTSLNQQGADKGPQYRSAIFYHDEAQKQAAEAMIARLTEEEEFRRPIVTQVEKLGTFYMAEKEHQDYFRRNPFAGYCQAVVRPKVLKFQKEFKGEVRKEGVGSRGPAAR